MGLFDDVADIGSQELVNITDDTIMQTTSAMSDSFNSSMADGSQLLNELGNAAIADGEMFVTAFANSKLDQALGLGITKGNWAGGKGNAAQDSFTNRLQTEQKNTVKGSSFKFCLKSLTNPSEVIILDVSPEITDTHTANYEQQNLIHSPFSFQIYKNSSSRTFEVQGKLISRTSIEATKNLNYINILRSWTKPYFGAGTAKSKYSKILGAPPDILSLSAYGPRHISGVPVVLSSASFPYPVDCDYIPTCNGETFPVIMNISITLLETYSPAQVSSFDMAAYKAGRLGMSFKAATVSSATQGRSNGHKRSSKKTHKHRSSTKAAEKVLSDSGELCNCKF